MTWSILLSYVNRETLGESFVNELEDRLLLNLLVSAISASHDTDKVRANAVRAVGNLLRYLPESRYQFESFKETAAKAVYSLISNISSGLMKVCVADVGTWLVTSLVFGQRP